MKNISNNYALIRPLVIKRYLDCGNIAKTAREYNINKKTVKAWLIQENIKIRQINVDIMGERFGRLLVQGCVGKDKFHKYIWRCKCNCGNEVNIRSNDLRQGKIKSCGCLHKETSSINGKKSAGSIRDRSKFCGEMSGKYYSVLRNNAIKRNLTFFVTKEFLWELFLKQGKKCALSGIALIINKTASVDRINSKVGYTEENVQWVHKDVNVMKMALNQEYFIDLCNKIYEFNKRIR